MTIPFYQVDAFTDERFKGNPAAICVLDKWPTRSCLQAIAAENNLSETAFICAQSAGYAIRWFTPTTEVDLCGHATLAAAYVVFNHLNPQLSRVDFNSRSGLLTVYKDESGWLTMNFPSRPAQVCAPPPALIAGLGHSPDLTLVADDYLAVFEDEATIRALQPDFELLKQLDKRGVIVTARGTDCDVVSRFFAPNYGINEDPVTGSAHCTLTPYWCEQLHTNDLVAKQISARTGSIRCELRDNRVWLSGQAVLVIEGVLHYG
ncbi:PhzF family phenazine biosynthesis protein [Agitococcus lubricus]|uniref:PhzF family phenazine biosynthesis protein n=1 Tax=Agitococcus lubricus TaxID=1077255 RepID=A0A2T5IYS0_9GAMM|nr:PhzF family phenazine biosynthesis protein [Agitococcus lubricus]PTQ89052.1 PhzF family phenazine biosynthesis protein [Agitococcus lubricus]